jgi:hypothetical protein
MLVMPQADTITFTADPDVTAGDLDDDDIILKDLDDSILRRVFRGLCGDG